MSNLPADKMQIEIERKDQTYRFDARSQEKLLYAGLRAGVPLPFECATGTCGSCKARLSHGSVNPGWQDAAGRKHLRSERRELLMCQATADSACKLRVVAGIRAFREDDICPDHYRGVVSKWEKLTRDVLRFEVSLPSPVKFHPGQFFVLQAPGVDGYRAYSMVNFAPQTDCLEFIIKQKPDGGFSNWAFGPAREDGEIALFGRLGRATFHADESHDLFMIAGGSGIAGLMSILEHGCQSDYFSRHKAELYFGVRTQEDLFFADRLASVKSRFPQNIGINIVFSEQAPDTRRLPESDWFSCQHGMVHEHALPAVSTGAANTMIYLAGPAPMVDALIRPLILDAKFAVNRIRYDKFS